MKNLVRQLPIVVLLFTSSSSFACDADVLRLNYRKTPATRPAPKPVTTLQKNTHAFCGAPPSSTSRSASMKLEQR